MQFYFNYAGHLKQHIIKYNLIKYFRLYKNLTKATFPIIK